MNWFAVCVFAFVALYPDAYANLGDKMAKTIKICCNEGHQFARQHDCCDGPFPISTESQLILLSMCSMAQQECCKDYIRKKIECEKGIHTSVSIHNCASSKNTSQVCCQECIRGTSLGASEGPAACQKQPKDTTAKEILSNDAFVKCCEITAKNWEESSSQRISNDGTSSPLPSMCEEYAPNELCAHRCISIPGTYECECNPGFMLMDDGRNCMEVTKDRCIHCQHKCNDNGVEVKCYCNQGYELMPDEKSCQDIDECQLEKIMCPPDSKCHNFPGSYACLLEKKNVEHNIRDHECPFGYSWNDENNACEDIDECAISTHHCGANYSCYNLKGTYRCDEPTIIVIKQFFDLKNENETSSNISPKEKTTTSTPKPRLSTSKPNGEVSHNTSSVRTPEEEASNNPVGPDVTESNSAEPSDKTPKVVIPPPPPIPHKPPVVVASTRIPPKIPEGELPQNTVSAPTTLSIPAETDLNPRVTTIKPSPKPPVNDNNSTISDDKDKTFKNSTNPKDCQAGFAPDKYRTCFDIDECATSTHTCSALSEICKNTLGGYTCNCAPGFRRDLTTKSCDRTTSSTTSTTALPPTLPPAPSNPDKSSVWGNSSRALCDVGYHYNVRTSTCEDINECTNGQASCAAVEKCVNTVGGYRCDCPPNWRLHNISHRCVPDTYRGRLIPPGHGNKPEPRSNDTSPGNKYLDPSIIQIEDRGTVIKCPAGYTAGDDKACIDINECETGEAKCSPLQICNNLPGGYSCICPSGHKLNADQECEDINECANESHFPVCSKNANCVNTIGSYRCQCHNGFRPAPVNDKVCVDVDECMASRAGALCQQKCINIWGGYQCACHRGYRLKNDNSTCSDIDECDEYKSKFLCTGQCVNELGSYRCTCPSGYDLAEDMKSCIDIDECETGEAPCSNTTASNTSNSICINIRGSYKCHRISCPVGYRLENPHRCTKVKQTCPLNDWACSHQPTTISYNFITFVSNMYIPDGQLKLFTMRGPAWPNAKLSFQLRFLNVNSPLSVKNKADIHNFLITQQSQSEALVSLVRPLEGPQSIELEMSMELYTDEQYGGNAVAKLFIYVSEYEF